MSFLSWSFVILFAIVFASRLTIGRKHTEFPYVLVLLSASTVFYAWHTPWHLAILVGNTMVDYVAARLMGPYPAKSPQRRVLVTISLVANLSLLGFFKYADFFATTTNRLFGSTLPVLGLVLPMGISFYTFQSMSYTIDVYRGKLPPVRDYLRFYFFVVLFPQLVSGPIARATEFLPQIPRRRRLALKVLGYGLFLIVKGYFLKMVCADNLATYVNARWANGYVAGADSTELILLTVFFSFQIFCDFEGYSCIARGLAYLLGFRLPINFDNPYRATSFKNFWERWHITLSRWLRDYLYVSLGGNRVGKFKVYANLMTVMVLGGLWHGASFTFLVWGFLHGAALAIERFFGLEKGKGIVWWVVVQITVLVTWIFFRSNGLRGALSFLANIGAGRFGVPDWALVGGMVFLVPPVLMHLRGTAGVRERAIWTGLMLVGILVAYGKNSAFIYFQF